MHECPDCGQACYCSGDIDDHDTGPFYECEHECEEYEEYEDDEDWRNLDELDWYRLYTVTPPVIPREGG